FSQDLAQHGKHAWRLADENGIGNGLVLALDGIGKVHPSDQPVFGIHDMADAVWVVENWLDDLPGPRRVFGLHALSLEWLRRGRRARRGHRCKDQVQGSGERV